MYHSITFGEKNTWDDWHLIPKTRPLIKPPTVKTNYVEIPGGDGILDLTDSLSGRPLYKNRTGSFEFYVENGYRNWAVLYSEIMVYLQGRKLRIILEDDSGYYYEGRCSVNDWKSDPQNSLITIDYDVAPYKKDINSSLDNWLWDTFNFNTGVIRYYKDMVIDGTRNVRVVGSSMPTTVIISTSNTSMSVTFNDVTYALPKGPSIVKEIVITDGINNLLFTGNGIISIEYSGGAL